MDDAAHGGSVDSATTDRLKEPHICTPSQPGFFALNPPKSENGHDLINDTLYCMFEQRKYEHNTTDWRVNRQN